MWTELAAAGGGALAALAPELYKDIRDRDAFNRKLSPLQKAVPGSWAGQGNDHFVEDDTQPRMSFQLHLDFKVRRRSRLVGKGTIEAIFEGKTVSQRIELNGGFFDYQYLQLLYRASLDTARVQLGVAILRLEPEGDQLMGRYAGFSPTRKCFVSGEVNLRRV